MKITVCIGSSCHIKGSRQVVEELQYLIKENNLSVDALLCDGLHPNDEGYRVMFGLFKEAFGV